MAGKADRGRFIKSLQYSLDNTFSRGPWVLVVWLGVLSLIIILAAALALHLTRIAPGAEEGYTFIEALWVSVLRTLGSGTFGGRETVWGYRLIMLGITLGSIFVYGTLVGALTNGMRGRVEELRKGRSEVMERGHIVILGWSEQIFTVVEQLVTANASEPKACIVVLADRDKIEMDDELRDHIGATGRVRIVCRTGDPLDMRDLSIARLNAARTIVVLSPDTPNPDADVIKVVLAILNHPQRRKEPYHIVAGIRSPKNTAITEVIGPGEVEWARLGEMISRIIAQTCRQAGLSAVYNELLDFGSHEIYFHTEPGLVGKNFGEALTASKRDTVIGLYDAGGKVVLNPPTARKLLPEDQLIVLSSDNRSIRFDPQASPEVQKEAIRAAEAPPSLPERTLLLGWNWRGASILRELDQYVSPGSDVMVAADRATVAEEVVRDCYDLHSLRVCFKQVETTDRQALEDLDLSQYDHVILLSCSDVLNHQQADALTLMTLLHVRDIAKKGGFHYSVVTEMLDIHNSRLVDVTRLDDFIVSDRLVSLLMSQVAENKAIHRAFKELFDPHGCELYLKPAGWYVQPGIPVNFYTVLEAARQRGELAVGYRLVDRCQDPSMSYGVVVNPHKPDEVTFQEHDRIIVISSN